MTNDEMTNAEYFHRSAAVPVTMVSAVSMNTIWKRNITITPTSYVRAAKHHPFLPKSPQSFPNRWIANSEFSGGVPPRLATAPTPPSWIAKPMTQ